jgi:FkbM family methyltransferase
MRRILRTYGIARSLLIYYGKPFWTRRTARFYAQFVRPGDLCFDIGAHVGSRLRALLHSGARVVAAEPQPAFIRLLQGWYGGRPDVRLVGAALGAAPGEAELLISRRMPSVTTLSTSWKARLSQSRKFAHVRWDGKATVPVTTLDALIKRHGEPVFCKIDVEGSQLEVLRGLSRALRTISFEYIPLTIEVALACIERVGELGDYTFNRVAGEAARFVSPDWLSGPQMAAQLRALKPDEHSGDVYARLRGVDHQ